MPWDATQMLVFRLIAAGLLMGTQGQLTTLCADPTKYNASHEFSPGLSCGAALAFVSTLVPPNGACDDSAGDGATAQSLLWTYAAGCCGDDPRPEMTCGWETVCNQTSQFQGANTFLNTNFSCATITVSNFGNFVTTRNCSETGEFINTAAAACCTGGMANANQACGLPLPSYTPGLMCANQSDFQGSLMPFSTSCSQLDMSFSQAGLYTNASVCDAANSDSTWGSVFAWFSPLCCGSGGPAPFCPAYFPVLPCASPADFNTSSPIPLLGGTPCGAVASFFTGLQASGCSQPTDPNSSTTVGDVFLAAGAACCNDQPPNPLCGTYAPTAGTPAPPPRVGQATACGGTYAAFGAGAPGASTCTGTPVLGPVPVVGPCAPVQNGLVTEYVAVISNGGACVGFSSQAECTTAMASVDAIIAGNNVSAYSASAQCYLDTSPCQFVPTFNAYVLIVPDCSTASPTAAPSASPTTTQVTSMPTEQPSSAPTSIAPTDVPTSLGPTAAPVTPQPTDLPTTAPTSAAPTDAPTSAGPTTPRPTTVPTDAPTMGPTVAPTNAPTTPPCDVTVTTPGLVFSPAAITITAGQRVCFTPGASHNVVQTDAAGSCAALTPAVFGSATLGQQVEHTFSSVGTFFFKCGPHCGAGMTGSIQVVAATATPSPSLAPTGVPTNSGNVASSSNSDDDDNDTVVALVVIVVIVIVVMGAFFVMKTRERRRPATPQTSFEVVPTPGLVSNVVTTSDV
eukprot:m.45166 g.45166  ORF g.45166 m.45166 type:complete len:737 (-) comp8610_c0_seq1:188-2398(-)